MIGTEQKRPSSAFTAIDFDKPGKQIGHVMFPHSPHDDAWGVTRVPIAVIANGRGPTVILEGGNHGDEYEGPIVIGELTRELDPAEIQGRLILMPANNVHAVMGSRRTSPVDGLNYNRTFPGDPYGTITQQISAYVTDRILPMGDAFLDLHSGGSSLDITPSAIIEPTNDPALAARNAAAARAFDAPSMVVVANLGDPRTATATACRAGLTTLGTELGGGGRVSIEALRICRRGVRNVLAHLEVIDRKHQSVENPDTPTFELKGASAYVYASAEGIFEPFHLLGTRVSAGQPAGQIHAVWDPGREPQVVHYACDGVVFARRQPGRVTPGNCCMVVAAPL
ncbi:MAG TPA: succinylglutamate desuccinylase/aspartoacylase family protein [Dongiaceae bacterium]|nr:succinylglutamate desuccinylase/aspartoacylase family protein [Dongiaceae bacterium]